MATSSTLIYYSLSSSFKPSSSPLPPTYLPFLPRNRPLPRNTVIGSDILGEPNLNPTSAKIIGKWKRY
ncbi:unnamed protein product [Amaranthus hypochondriacus]